MIAIAGREISEARPPYMVAELSGNHGGDLGRAKALLDAAKAAGADAAKLQTYTPDSITIDHGGPGRSAWCCSVPLSMRAPSNCWKASPHRLSKSPPSKSSIPG